MRTALVVIAAVVLTTSAPARAEVVSHRRVVLVGMPEVVVAATTAALEPWAIAVVVALGPPPADDGAAATIARDHDATAVAWLDGDELVIYDDVRHTAERRATAPPTDDVTAAAIALSIKTALRRPIDVVQLPAVIEIPPPPAWQEAPPEPPPPPPLPRVRPIRLAAHLGGHAPLPMIRADLRASVELPRRSTQVVAAIGGGALVSFDTENLTRSSYREAVIGAGLGWRRDVWNGIQIVPSALATLHVSHLEGVSVPSGRSVARTMTAVGVELAVAADRAVGGLRIGGVVTGGVLQAPTRYTVQGREVLVVPRLSLGFALRLAF